MTIPRAGSLVAALLIAAYGARALQAQVVDAEAAGYRHPGEVLARLIDVPPTPVVSVSPGRTEMLLLSRSALPTIEELAAEELRIAGLRIDPANNGQSRSSDYLDVAIRSLDADADRAVTGLPESTHIRSVSWSPDGERVALVVATDARLELWVLDLASAAVRRLSDRALNGVFGAPCTWQPDGSAILCLTVPEGRGAPPAAPRAPAGPVIQQNEGEEAPVRTYQDLLSDRHDEALFEFYGAGELTRFDLQGGETTLAGPAIYTSVDPSPDGQYVLVERTHRPYSYLVPYYRFSRAIEVLDPEGKLVHTLADLPPAEDVPTGFGSVPTGPRSVSWRADAPSSLLWVEALDGGDSNVDAEWRDAVYLAEAPFDETPQTVMRLALRYSGTGWLGDGRALVNETWWRTRARRVHLVDLRDPASEPRLLLDYSTEDRYNDPGDPLYVWSSTGTRLVATTPDGSGIYLSGDGASPEGDRPFLRRLDLEDGSTEQLFRSEAPYFETPVALLDDDAHRLLTRRESIDQPANYVLRDLRAGGAVALTDIPHPYPDLAAISREIITYEREDGLSLSAELYLPPGYDQERDGPLPTLIWAYPVEYNSSDAAGQVSGSPYAFKNISYWGALPFLTQGYAVLDRTAMPIVGEGEAEPNDTFRSQLVMNARAAILEGARRGVVDPDRVAIGGHSYGAFMTANLLAHSDLFRAGIARSGAYNRTLTPFGFQREERTYWEAPDVYNAMSPFMHADKVNEPILLIHGEADNNSGTFPIQSERFYAALKGHGATARLVFFPHESHGYRARESLLHMLWEENRWLEMYVKNAPPRPASDGQPVDTGG